ncbi:MAG: hypothetical protein KJ950_09575 [Proteobacteria bacterium]|nr:hypothetical protein [Pseudomonadota bacterium]MBU1688903.1 hypothetical protein [Pseudomonadota bacterium]
MQRLLNHSINMEKVRTIIYHLPDGQSFVVPIDGLEPYIELGFGDICDTSEIDGVVHYFPKGNA